MTAPEGPPSGSVPSGSARDDPPVRTESLDVFLMLLPVMIAWSGVLVSAWASGLLPETRLPPDLRTVAAFVGGPALSFFVLLAVRAAASSAGVRLGRPSRVVLAWFMLFLLAVHGLVLALAFGRVQQPATALAPAIGALFLGLAPLVTWMEPGSILGIRTSATLASPETWRRTHRLLGLGFLGTGLCGVGAIALEGSARVLAVTAPVAIALTAAILYGTFAGPRDGSGGR